MSVRWPATWPLALGAEGHVSALRRERVGPFSVENAVTLDFLDRSGA
jgi:tRNA U55 pseudouridine synthase TruB